MNSGPATLKAVAERSDSIRDFGLHLRDWLHELRRVSSRRQAAAAVADEPPRLSQKFPEGEVADVWLAAYAEHLAGKAGTPPPEWAFESWRISEDPIFAEGDTPVLRILALIHSPLAFKRRNIFMPSVDLGVRYGINQRAAQEVLGHSDANLTAKAYTDVPAPGVA